MAKAKPLRALDLALPHSRNAGGGGFRAKVPAIPSGAPISELPLALIPTAAVPLLFALHITSVSALARTSRTPLPATAPLTAAI